MFMNKGEENVLVVVLSQTAFFPLSLLLTLFHVSPFSPTLPSSTQPCPPQTASLTLMFGFVLCSLSDLQETFEEVASNIKCLYYF